MHGVQNGVDLDEGVVTATTTALVFWMKPFHLLPSFPSWLKGEKGRTNKMWGKKYIN